MLERWETPASHNKMTASEIIKKWQGVQLKEKSTYQEHFLDLCKLVEHPSPVETDKEGVAFCFEKGAIKTGGGNGWADVWKRGHFAMEYKGPGGDLQKALQQVQRYALALENPPLLVVSDVATIIITTNFTNTVSETHTIALEDTGTPDNLRKLRWMFYEPAQLRPGITTAAITEKAATLFASLAQTFRERGAIFGILSSRIHEVWSLAQASMHGDGDNGGRPTYNAKSCFATFPFPEGVPLRAAPFGPHADAIAVAARNLNELRERWLNPPEWTDRIPEVVSGYPDRIVPKLGHEQDLKTRTLTNLYNERPQWLRNAHLELDVAVAHAYGWLDYAPEMTDDEILKRLLALNLARS